MNDMSQVIIPKSDQISADDFLAGPKTYLIEEVEIRPGTEQPVSIFMAGEPRAWRPCKSMSRCLVAAWGPDANVYKGRSVTLYRDPKVKWGGMEVGGIRVSHMSHIEREMLLQLTATKGKRAPHIVKPLVIEQPADKAADGARTLLARITSVDPKNIGNITGDPVVVKQRAWLAKNRPELAAEIDAAVLEAEGDPFGPDDSQRGEDHTDPREAIIGNIRDLIEGAETLDDLKAASDLLDRHEAALPGEVAEALALELGAKKLQLGEG